MGTKKLTIVYLAVLLSLTMSLVFPAGVLADDGTPPPPPEATEVAAPPQEAPTEEGAASDAVVPESPATEEPALTEEAAIPEVETQDSSGNADPLADVAPLLEQLPEGTDVVVLNDSGSPVPLASQEAADIMQEADPMWCPVTAATVTSDCVNHATVTGLLALFTGKNADGVIYFMSTYGANDATFNGTNANLVGLSDNALTIQGGWNGTTTLNSAISYTGSSAFSVPLVITNWTGNIFVNDITISNVSSTASLTVSTAGDITLDNVDVLNQTTSGLFTTARNTAILTSTSGDITVQNGSSFDGSGRNRGFSATTTSGSIYIADTTFQEASGGLLADYNGATLSAPTITLTNVTARNNDLNGIAITNANTVTLNSVTATSNGTLIWGSGVKISGTGSSKVLVNYGAFTNNKGYGIELTGGTGNRLFVQAPPTSCSGNIWGCYNVSAIPVVLGCTDPTAFNYNPSANTDDGSCVAVVRGCTDPTAFNYNSAANTDDGSCVAVVLGCTDETAFNYNSEANTDDGTCEAVVLGCTDETAFNYNSEANTDDESCEAVVLGCTDETAFNYNSEANTDDESCEAVVLGCTDETAFNYSAEANTDDESCEAVVPGCTNETASNYSSAANTDNGTCASAGSSSFTSTGSFIIPVTGNQAIDLSCSGAPTSLEMAGFQVSFDNLCGYSAELGEIFENGLSGALPTGSKYVSGIDIALLQNDNLVDTLPADANVILSFEIPSGLNGESLAILYWDPTANGGAGGWVEQSVTVTNGKVVLAIDMPGTFVLVNKGTTTTMAEPPHIAATFMEGFYVAVIDFFKQFTLQ